MSKVYIIRNTGSVGEELAIHWGNAERLVFTIKQWDETGEEQSYSIWLDKEQADILDDVLDKFLEAGEYIQWSPIATGTK